MKDLIIITTYSKNLPSEKGKEPSEKDKKPSGLFSKLGNFKEQPVRAPSLTEIFGAPRNLWRIEGDQLVFGAACLDKNNRNEQYDKEKKCRFIQALVKDVVESLDEESKKSIGRLFLFAHGYDLNRSKIPLGPVTDHELQKDRSWLDGLLPAEIKVEVFFMAFSHDHHALHRLLESGAPIISSEKTYGKQLTYFYDIVAGWRLDTDWLETWITNEKGKEEVKIKNSQIKFHFAFYYASAALEGEIPPAYPKFHEVKDLIEKQIESGNKRKVNIVFIPIVEITAYNDRKFYEKVIATFYPDKKGGKDAAFAPTIFIGYKNIMIDPVVEELKGNKLDPRYRFLDSSIWYRYVAIEGNFSENLQSALDTIDWAYHHNLYKKNVCREFVEFHNRLVQNSYLSDQFGDGHSLSVFPFVFHSESKMRNRASALYDKFQNKNLKWNILLLDDYAELEMRESSLEIRDEEQHHKGRIIEELLKASPSVNPDGIGESIVNDYEKCASARDSIEKYFADKDQSNETENREKNTPGFLPDIILLDYLFSHPENDQHFGTEVLTAIADKKAVRGRSVSQAYWIHPISVFNEAMFSDMQEKSYQHFEADWYLARGADPINTPHLFRCSLFEFMDVQSEMLLFDQEELWEFLINQNLKNAEESNGDASPIDQNKVLNAFRNLLEQFSADEGIDPASAIGRSAKLHMLRSKDKDALELRDHLRRILFLLAFTAGFDFPAIEREFLQIDRIYIAYYSDHQHKKDHENRLKKLKEAMDTLAEWVYSFAYKYA